MVHSDVDAVVRGGAYGSVGVSKHSRAPCALFVFRALFGFVCLHCAYFVLAGSELNVVQVHEEFKAFSYITRVLKLAGVFLRC